MIDQVAAIQMNSSANVRDNMLVAAELIAQAASKQAQLVVLPEMFALISPDVELKMATAEPWGVGPIQAFLAYQALQHHIWLVGGTILIRADTEQKAYAACLLFNPQGEVVARYHKMHLFDVAISEKETHQESATIIPGEAVIVATTSLGTVGLAVCYDIRFPELFRVMLNHGVELFAVPAAFTVPTGSAHWEILARSRAIENFCYFVGACQVGQHAGGRQTYGHSVIINPWGEILAQLDGDGIGVITAPIDLPYLHRVRQQIPAKDHQRIFDTKVGK